MPKYSVIVRFTESAYCEVEADDVDQAEEKAQAAIDSNNLEPYGDEDISFEVEEMD